MTLLVLYLLLAIGVSFVCSLCEATLLSLTASDAEVLAKTGSRAGEALKRLKASIDRPLAAILTLNTISHTVGAAGVGAQSIVVFGEAWVGATSAVLTLLILFVSEIVPKTIGATYARPLATVVTWTILGMIWITYPVVVVLDWVSRLLRGSAAHGALSREQIEVIAELARGGGSIEDVESAVIRNMLGLSRTTVDEVMTPRTVLFTLSADATAAGALEEAGLLRFSRIPVTGDGPDDVLGLVLKHDIHRAVIEGAPERRIGEMLRPMKVVPEQATLLRVLEQFGQGREHIFLVVDEYGGTSGVVTLEDVFESILGDEIVDETDPAADMRVLASRSRAAVRRDGVAGESTPELRSAERAPGEEPSDII